MRWTMTMAVMAAALAQAGCGGGGFWAGEAKAEPIYCYRSLAGVECFKTPVPPDEKRLVSYNGPAPETYARPAPPPEPILKAPEMVPFYVKDPEPVPEADPPKRRAAAPATKAPAPKR